jgi:hypothetical protein
MVSMLRSRTFRALLLLAPLAAGCGDDQPNGPTAPEPVAVTEQINSGDNPLNPNGGRTHPFDVLQPGTVSARLTGLSPDDTITVGLSLGTWNGQVCQILLANDAAVLNVTVTGTAQQTGRFCVRIYDVGKLTASTDYSIELTHF